MADTLRVRSSNLASSSAVLLRSLWSVVVGYTGFREGGELSAKLYGQKKLSVTGKILLKMLHSGITWTLMEWSSSPDTAIRCLAIGFGRNSLLMHGEREACRVWKK